METRPLKELLQIMLDNMKLSTTGLCGLANRLYLKSIITFDEKENLQNYIHIDSIPITSNIKIRCRSRSINRDVDNICIRTLRKSNRIALLFFLGKSGTKANRILYLKEQISLLNT